MADDVKVKFGGDFSDIDKDAQSASKRIGTALGAWVNEYSGEVKHKLKEAFSLGNILEKYAEGVKEYFKKFEDIDNLAKKLGVTRVELQQFGKLGEEMGVDMETMGQAIAFANRQIGGMKDNDKIRKLMLDLGFSTREVTSANIKSLDVLYKLADAYEQNKKHSGETAANNMLAKDSADLFGRSAYNLNGIIKEGTSALKERIETMKVFSETEVKAAASTSKMIKHGEESLKDTFYGKPIALYASLAGEYDIAGMFGGGGMVGKTLEATGMGGYEEAMKSPEAMEKFAKEFAKQGKKKGFESDNLMELIELKIASSVGMSSEKKDFYRQLQVKLESYGREERLAQGPASTIPLNNQTVLAASSLQQLGGGDVSSVLAGSRSNDVAENTLRTANAVEQIASQGDAPNEPTNQAK